METRVIVLCSSNSFRVINAGRSIENSVTASQTVIHILIGIKCGSFYQVWAELDHVLGDLEVIKNFLKALKQRATVVKSPKVSVANKKYKKKKTVIISTFWLYSKLAMRVSDLNFNYLPSKTQFVSPKIAWFS